MRGRRRTPRANRSLPSGDSYKMAGLAKTSVLVISVGVAACSAETSSGTGGLSVGDGGEADSSASPTETGGGEGSADASSSPASSSGSDPSSGEASEGGGPLLDVGNDDPPPGCASSAEDFMFLLESTSGALHRYDPDANTIVDLGTPQCAGADVPMALTIDRSGLLWVLMSDADGVRLIYTIDPETLACDATAFADPFDQGMTVTGGLAFVADAPDSADETLYIGMLMGGLDPSLPLTLAEIDVATMDFTTVGELPIVANDYYQIPDLVGTGDSRLFGFFTGDNALIAELDEAVPTVILEQPLGFGVGSPWAFAQWSGRLWLFSPGAVGGSSEVRAYDLEMDMVEVIEPDLGVPVVGAAVSTCAPYEPAG